MPLTKLLGKTEFWGRPFHVNEHTLDPRPDSETVVEIALSHFKGRTQPKMILDLGIGTGCLLLTLLMEFPGAIGIGVDKSFDAISVARDNAKALGVESRAYFMQGNWQTAMNGKFDLIVSNPPYIRSDVIPTLDKNVQNYDPMLALDGGKDGLQAYCDIFATLHEYVHKDTISLFEIGFDQQEDIERLSEKYGFLLRCVHHDLAGKPRVVDIFWA